MAVRDRLLRSRKTALRLLQASRTHAFSMLSALVLAVALVLALTSSSLDLPDRPAEGGVAAVQDPAPTATAPGAARTATAYPLVVYYIVASEERRQGIEQAVQTENTARARMGLQPEDWTHRDFLLVRTEEEETAAYRLLNDLIYLSQVEGFLLRIVDLR